MVRFEMSAVVVSVVQDHFFVEVAQQTVIRVDIPEYADKPNVGDRATVAVEIW